MTIRIKKPHPALKHAGYSATSILPGESTAEFEKLHQELISEWAPNGALEDDIIATMARLLWRKKNLPTFRFAELAKEYMAQIRSVITLGMDCDLPKSDDAVEFEKSLVEKWRTAESEARNELGELYGLVEMGEETTIDGLMRQLEVHERLDAMIEKCVKRLLLVRGLKSISPASTSVPSKRLPGSSSVA
jgi:hypothetical protein